MHKSESVSRKWDAQNSQWFEDTNRLPNPD